MINNHHRRRRRRQNNNNYTRIIRIRFIDRKFHKDDQMRIFVSIFYVEVRIFSDKFFGTLTTDC